MPEEDDGSATTESVLNFQVYIQADSVFQEQMAEVAVIQHAFAGYVHD